MSSHTCRIKVCGLRRPEDVAMVNSARPEYAGFILAPSRRQVSLESLRELISLLDSSIIPVGVFVNPSIDEVIRAVRSGIRVVQLHGDEDADFVDMVKARLDGESLGPEIWKAFRISDRRAIEGDESFKSLIGSPSIDRILLDAFSKEAYGGTGETFDWELVNLVKGMTDKSVFVAGGLTSANVSELISLTSPYGVDVSSGVEKDGFKDEDMICDFVARVRKG